MRLADLNARQAVTPAALAAESLLYRVQLTAPRIASIVTGAVIMAPAGLLACRYDLAATAVAYFTFHEETALYETWARRTASSIPLVEIARRQLLTVRFAAGGLSIADLRPHAVDWPALQSSRYTPTQELAADLLGHAFDGAVYPSAQQFGRPCLALFGAAVAAVTRVRGEPLWDAARASLHRCVVDAARGAELPVV